MKKLYFILIITHSLCLSSCTLLFKTFYGVHDPRSETDEKVLRKAKKYNLNSVDIYRITNNDSLVSFYKFVNRNKYSYLSKMPEYFCFDAHGNFIKYKENKDCNGKGKYLPEFGFSKLLNMEKDTNLNLNSILKMYKPLNKVSKNDTPDIYCILPWGTYIGGLAKKYYTDWLLKVDTVNSVKLKVIVLSNDIY